MKLRNRLRASKLYNLYWSIVKPQIINDLRDETEFYRELGIGKGDLVFDIGANHGYKTGIFLGLGAEVVAVDPDPANIVMLGDKFISLRWPALPLTIKAMAVSAEEGQKEFLMSESGGAKNTLSQKWVNILEHDDKRFGKPEKFSRKRKVWCTTLDRLIRIFGAPKYIKIDVEGHELEVLKGLSQKVEMLSFEVNLPEFREEGFASLFTLQSMDASAKFNYVTDLAEGFKLDRWHNYEDFAWIFGDIPDPSIEVFWRTK